MTDPSVPPLPVGAAAAASCGDGRRALTRVFNESREQPHEHSPTHSVNAEKALPSSQTSLDDDRAH